MDVKAKALIFATLVFGILGLVSRKGESRVSVLKRILTGRW